METAGIHHVTAIAADPQRNVDFYADLLGLRLVKITVNFDDPSSYHLYYGDEMGSPGTVLTFFSWPREPRGQQGAGQVTAVSLAVPEGSLAYWSQRLGERGVPFQGPVGSFGEDALILVDPDGLPVELIAGSRAAGRRPWPGGPVPEEFAPRGLHSVTITEKSPERMDWLLSKGLGFRQAGRDGTRTRYSAGDGEVGTLVDMVWDRRATRGNVSVGSVHHMAFRAPDEEGLEEWRWWIGRMDLHVTPIQDRRYFRSIYFRQPGDVLFEIATDLPGFGVDEPVEQLGRSLQLPSWLERLRPRIEQSLPKLKLPALTR